MFDRELVGVFLISDISPDCVNLIGLSCTDIENKTVRTCLGNAVRLNCELRNSLVLGLLGSNFEGALTV